MSLAANSVPQEGKEQEETKRVDIDSTDKVNTSIGAVDAAASAKAKMKIAFKTVSTEK